MTNIENLTTANILDMISRTCRERADAVAAVCGVESLSYADLDQRSNQVANHLAERGVAPGTLVGICVERSLDMLVGLLGILKSGGAYVPLDPAYPADRIAYMLEHSSAPIVLTQEALAKIASGYRR